VTTLKENLERLLSTGRGKGRLKPAPERDKINAATSEGVNASSVSAGGTGVTSPLTETINSGTYNLTSSDGLFVIEIPQQTTYEDALTIEYTFIHKAPT